MSRQPSDFEAWFIAQHGKRPGLNLTDEQMLEAMQIGDVMREKYLRRLDWYNRHTSALYAWQARDKPRKVKRR